MIRLSVPDMSCGHCKASIETALTRLDPAARVEVDLEGRSVQVDSSVPQADLIRVLEQIGFPANAA